MHCDAATPRHRGVHALDDMPADRDSPALRGTSVNLTAPGSVSAGRHPSGGGDHRSCTGPAGPVRGSATRRADPTAAGAVGAARARAGAYGGAEPDAAPRGGPTTAAATQAQAESQAGRAPTGTATRAGGSTRTCCGSARALPGTGQSGPLNCQCSGDVAGTTSRLARKGTSATQGSRKSSASKVWPASASLSIVRAGCCPSGSTRAQASLCLMTRCWS
jgi:hypothetical protein